MISLNWMLILPINSIELLIALTAKKKSIMELTRITKEEKNWASSPHKGKEDCEHRRSLEQCSYSPMP